MTPGAPWPLAYRAPAWLPGGNAQTIWAATRARRFSGPAPRWRRATAAPHLAAIRIPALLLNARNDPFVPLASLPPTERGSCARRLDAHGRVALWQPPQGGHVGFPAGRYPAQVRTMPQAVCDWLAHPAWV